MWESTNLTSDHFIFFYRNRICNMNVSKPNTDATLFICWQTMSIYTFNRQSNIPLTLLIVMLLLIA